MFYLFEDYLDKEEKFWDYKTKTFDGINPFDQTKGESPFVRQLLNDPDYMRDSKNLISKIELMTPKEYFEECAEIFDSTFENQINQIKPDKQILDKLKEVLFTYKRTFPITYLNYAEKGQEGRHRMYLIGELFGWDKKYPVLIITHANEEKVKKENEAKELARKKDIQFHIEEVIDKIKSFEFYSIEEIIEEIKYRLEFNYYKNDIIVNQDENNNLILIKVKDVEYKISIYEFQLEDVPMEYSDLDESELEDIDINDLSWIHK